MNYRIIAIYALEREDGEIFSSGEKIWGPLGGVYEIDYFYQNERNTSGICVIGKGNMGFDDLNLIKHV